MTRQALCQRSLVGRPYGIGKPSGFCAGTPVSLSFALTGRRVTRSKTIQRPAVGTALTADQGRQNTSLVAPAIPFTAHSYRGNTSTDPLKRLTYSSLAALFQQGSR